MRVLHTFNSVPKLYSSPVPPLNVGGGIMRIQLDRLCEVPYATRNIISGPPALGPVPEKQDKLISSHYAYD